MAPRLPGCAWWWVFFHPGDGYSHELIFCPSVQQLSHGLFATPWTVACLAPLSTGFPGQEYCSRLPFPAAGDLPHPGIELTSLASVGSLPLCHLGSPCSLWREITPLRLFQKAIKQTMTYISHFCSGVNRPHRKGFSPWSEWTCPYHQTHQRKRLKLAVGRRILEKGSGQSGGLGGRWDSKMPIS